MDSRFLLAAEALRLSCIPSATPQEQRQSRGVPEQGLSRGLHTVTSGMGRANDSKSKKGHESVLPLKMEFFTIILEKSSRLVLPHNFVNMLDGHRPQNMKLRQAGNGLRKLWDVEVVFDADGRMYLDRGWKQFVRAYDLGIGYFLVFRYDGNATFVVKVFDTTMCRWRYQDDDDAGNGSRSSEYYDRCYVYGSSDSGDSKSSSDDGLAMDVPQLGDRAMPIMVEEYIPQPGLGLRRSKRIKMMKEKVKKQE
ncbi:B3 domain-containing protein [Hordeum vulgare]|nr:B3 domain-containing protein [Hordeum vulgare]